MFNNKNKVVPTPPYETNNYVINTKVLSWGEDLGEGFARRVTANECSPLSPSPSPSEREASAFTLAEVLITLVIIGVIAAITVPTLMNKTNNQEYVSKLKKAYSTLSQATNLIIAEEGTPRADKGGWAKDADNVYNLYKKHLNNAKECGVILVV
ncbi:type II secretion system protein [bacterium]|nr:type II secretion system protein [bacterium]